MEGEKNLVVNGVNIKCIGYYGYNNHYYVTLYNDDSGAYMGQLVDAKISDSNLEAKIEKLVKESVYVS